MPRRKTRKTRRRQRGGAKPRNIGDIKWPGENGCLGPATVINIEKGTLIDRFGPSTGNFVSPVPLIQYTYLERALPYYGQENNLYMTANGKTMGREAMYYSDFEIGKIQDDDYHIYRVLNRIINVESCTIAPHFQYPGQGIQYKLPKAVQEYLANGSLEEIKDFPVIPRFK